MTRVRWASDCVRRGYHCCQPCYAQGDVEGSERMLQKISRVNRKTLPLLCISKYGNVDDDKEEGIAGVLHVLHVLHAHGTN